MRRCGGAEGHRQMEVGHVKILGSILENSAMSPPLFLLYKAMKLTKAGRTCHLVSVWACDGLMVDNIKTKANDLRKMTYTAWMH